MDKELKKAIKKILWLDDIFVSSDSIWGILDDIEDELEELLGSSSNKKGSLVDWFKPDDKHDKDY